MRAAWAVAAAPDLVVAAACYAITVICKGKPDSFMPANLAVAGVPEGRYRAKLGAGD